MRHVDLVEVRELDVIAGKTKKLIECELFKTRFWWRISREFLIFTRKLLVVNTSKRWKNGEVLS